jgi:uncharacterized protein YqgC (DUF456 family)
MSIVFIILGFILLLAGLLGCILPSLPGPPLSYLALILLQIARKGEAFSTGELIFWGVLTALVFLVDYVIPVLGAKKFGATKYGLWGCVIGMLTGLILFPPFGLFIGAFCGAVAGELIFGKQSGEALKAGWGVFLGVMLSAGLKLAACTVMTFIFIRTLF